MKQDTPTGLPSRINRGWRIGIVHSSYYKEEVGALVSGAAQALRDAGIPPANIKTYAVPGSFEIPLVGAELARKQEVDALIGIGVIVEGETHHARLIAEQAARGMMDVQVRSGVPFAFEVLYVQDLALARARLEKGEEAARCVLHSLALIERL
ncbi:MAG: 6,7-dimethyl-8-ribityllumazine synthase [Candidatus Peribacteraceae bacterium]|jgi:6,7-dimethyl-8-ribityllumazine synthase